MPDLKSVDFKEKVNIGEEQAEEMVTP